MPYPRSAVRALSAKLVGVDRHAVSGLKRGHAVARLFDDSGKFMAQNGAGRRCRRTLVALENVHIRSANAARHNFYQHLSRARLGLFDLLDLKIVFFIKYRRFHFYSPFFN